VETRPSEASVLAYWMNSSGLICFLIALLETLVDKYLQSVAQMFEQISAPIDYQGFLSMQWWL
jgi:hypothetical protein